MDEDLSRFQRVRVVKEYPQARSEQPFYVYTMDGPSSLHFQPLTIERKQIEELYWDTSKHEAITVLGDRAIPLEYGRLSTIV